MNVQKITTRLTAILLNGYSVANASNMALADTIVYIPIFKYDAVCICEASYSFFTAFFSNDSLMHFWNNCYGRAYPEQGYANGIEAYEDAFDANELVLNTSSSQLTSSRKNDIWAWDWYTY